MISLFNTPINSPALITLTIVYAVAASITTFDIRLIQAKKDGRLPANEPMLPAWTGLFGWLMWAVWLAIFLLNWWYAFVVFIAKFVLKVLPVLETIGNILMSPFRPRNSN